jgi:PIN domain
MTAIVTPVPASSHEELRASAPARIGQCDPRDWPVPACALRRRCPIWTGDRGFFAALKDQVAPWHFLYLRPLPHGHGSLRPTLGASRTMVPAAGADLCVVRAGSS